MRVFIIGSKDLSVHILSALLKHGHEVVGAFSRDDEPGMKIWHDELGHKSLKRECERANIPCYEGMNVNSDLAFKILSESNLDVIFSCFWGQIIKQKILDLPRMGIFNLHTAYLPLNRGSRPIPWALIKGEMYTGITLHKMASGVDNGPILDQKKVYIDEKDTAKTLYEKVTHAGKVLFDETLSNFETFYSTKLRDQNDSVATYQPRGEPFGGQINRFWDEEKKDRFRRAFTFPPFRAYRNPPDQLGNKPLPYFVIDENLAVIDLPEPIKRFRVNSIGSKDDRKTIRDLLPKDAIGVGFKEHIKGMYPIHDLMQQSGLGYSVSQYNSANKWIDNPDSYQPYRYENGVLEIPSIQLKNSKDITELAITSQVIAHQKGHDIFIGIHPVQPISVHNILEEISNTGIDELTFTKVYQLFDTDYEDIRA